MKPVLQVALDFVDLQRAIGLAKESVAGGAEWIEVGTPLIKSEGLDAVREIKRLFPKEKVVADMKTMDTGRYEVESAAKAGADVVILLGVAGDSTIREAVEAGRNYGCEIMIDLMNVKNMNERAMELTEMGVDYLCVHVSIDQQMSGINPIKELKRVSKSVRIPVAVAGGINSENVANAIKAGASVVIVGGAITKAGDAKKATRQIKKAMSTGRMVKSELYKKYLNPDRVFGKVSTANISDAMHRGGDLEGIVPVAGVPEGKRVVGRALTVRTYPGDWAKPVEAIDIAGKGDMIVIDAAGGGKAVWGELASESCKRKGIAGVVIDGNARDTEDIDGVGFPVFARGKRPSAGEPKGLGEINIPIRISGIDIKPGDYMVGDSDGVVVIPKEKAVDIANRAMDVFEKESRVREEIKRGGTISSVMEIKRWEKTR